MSKKVIKARVGVEVMLLVDENDSDSYIRSEAQSAAEEESYNADVQFEVFDPNTSKYPEGWDADTLIYHAGRGDLTVGDALAMCKVNEDES